MQWHPPPELDHGQHRINYLHRPELLLTPPEPHPHPELRPQPELDPDPDWDIKPHQQHEPDTEWDIDWNADWDNDFNPPTPSTPSVEHLWDPEPYALEIIEPEIPAGWTLLDTPDPWQPTSTGNAVSGKAVRGP
nr:hypothetical protein CPGR_06046 [Mycolicibacterium fortuitum subsp. fortuitum DSM 46621 = ATCC 6841 = JCM 6387]CRL70717.1 hypothetical protein CPGR_00571 [Mycolicibacter nonchromogenicus]